MAPIVKNNILVMKDECKYWNENRTSNVVRADIYQEDVFD